MPVNVEEWSWWLECKWLPGHRWTPQQVHHLLVRLMEKHGTGFMTTENVLRVMDSEDPEALVRQWLGEHEDSDQQTDVPPKHRRCMAPGCKEPRTGNGPAAKWCEEHAEANKRRTHRESKRRWRQKTTQ